MTICALRTARLLLLDGTGQVPLWVLEYKSLQLILRVVVIYLVFFHLVGFAALYLCAVIYGGDEVMGAGPWEEHSSGFSAFTTVMAFANAGISIRPTFNGDRIAPLVLVILDALILAGKFSFPCCFVGQSFS